MKSQQFFTLLAGLLVFVAITSGANALSSTSNEDSIRVGAYGSVSNWRAVARDQLIIWNGPSRAYLVKVWRPYANSLRNSETIGITRTNGRITKFDSILVRGQKLPIKFIRRIDPQVAKAMRYRT